MLKAHNIKSDIIINNFEDTEIKYAFHDIDGTHSLIREWPPVMSICLYDVIVNGLSEDFDSKENEKRIIESAGKNVLKETDRFCVESAGLSALTQMEWAIRRSVEEGKISINCDMSTNSEIIKRIWAGEETFDDLPETDEMNEMLKDKTPRLFKLYEAVLNGYCRDKNLEKAKLDPESFRIPGSMAFMSFLKEHGVKNYFVTGAVVEKGMGMYEEVEALGYKIGENQLAEDIIGSTWTEKMPKEQWDRIVDGIPQEGSAPELTELIRSHNLRPGCSILLFSMMRMEMEHDRTTCGWLCAPLAEAPLSTS